MLFSLTEIDPTLDPIDRSTTEAVETSINARSESVSRSFFLCFYTDIMKNNGNVIAYFKRVGS